MNIEEYKKLLKEQKSASKYHNKKVTFRGETFDSIKERDYYILLMDRRKRGEIGNIDRQVSILIQEGFTTPDGAKVKPITYIADFIYYDLMDNKVHYIDVKGYKTEVYKLKKKLLAYKGIYIEEV